MNLADVYDKPESVATTWVFRDTGNFRYHGICQQAAYDVI